MENAPEQAVDEQFLHELMVANLEDVESQLELLLHGRSAVDHIPKGLSTLTQYLLYRQQLLESNGTWIMADWSAVRTTPGRVSLIRKYQRPYTSLQDPERTRRARFLFSLFQQPVPVNSIGETEFFGFIDCILQSRIRYENHFQEGAVIFQDLEENCAGMKIPCVGFPGPPQAAQNWHLWAHATTREGATGILATGKALPTNHDVANLDQSEDTFSFFGRSMNAPEWSEGVVQLACKRYHSTKNCSGVVFAGLLPTGHVRGKRADVAYENNLSKFHALVHSCSSDRRWAIRFVAARIDFVFVLSDRAKANFPPDPARLKLKRTKALLFPPVNLALQDGSVDESWGQWGSRADEHVEPSTVKQEGAEPASASTAAP